MFICIDSIYFAFGWLCITTLLEQNTFEWIRSILWLTNSLKIFESTYHVKLNSPHSIGIKGVRNIILRKYPFNLSNSLASLYLHCWQTTFESANTENSVNVCFTIQYAIKTKKFSINPKLIRRYNFCLNQLWWE